MLGPNLFGVSRQQTLRRPSVGCRIVRILKVLIDLGSQLFLSREAVYVLDPMIQRNEHRTDCFETVEINVSL